MRGGAIAASILCSWVGKRDGQRCVVCDEAISGNHGCPVDEFDHGPVERGRTTAEAQRWQQGSRCRLLVDPEDEWNARVGLSGVVEHFVLSIRVAAVRREFTFPANIVVEIFPMPFETAKPCETWTAAFGFVADELARRPSPASFR